MKTETVERWNTHRKRSEHCSFTMLAGDTANSATCHPLVGCQFVAHCKTQLNKRGVSAVITIRSQLKTRVDPLWQHVDKVRYCYCCGRCLSLGSVITA